MNAVTEAREALERAFAEAEIAADGDSGDEEHDAYLAVVDAARELLRALDEAA